MKNYCSVAGLCGGCTDNTKSYEEQLMNKDNMIKSLLLSVGVDKQYEGITASPHIYEYRNKMEFTFGNSFKDGPLQLGMHKRKSFFDILSASECRLVDEDFRIIVNACEKYFSGLGLSFYHKKTHIGFLRHLVLRKGYNTGEICINLVSSSQGTVNEEEFIGLLLKLSLKGLIVSILHTINDNVSDAVKEDEMRVLYGNDYFHEELMGLKFKISAFSFFQTNTEGAALLYNIVREYAGDKKCTEIFDLYSGTGTISQVLSSVADKVIGVEIINEAVEAARENAKMNALNNCEFIAGDVGEIIGNLKNSPELIILDPPREGLQPKAMTKLVSFNAERIIYVSCKPTSLIRDLKNLKIAGYNIIKARAVDMFPHTQNLETVVLLSRDAADMESFA